MNEAFFTEAGRGLLIEQLVHHGSFTQDVILLTGPEGVGKTACASALVNELVNDVTVLLDLKAPSDMGFVDRQLASSPDGRLLQQFLSGDLDDGSGYRAWLIVDDAQLLSTDTLLHISHQFNQLESASLVLCIDQQAVADITAVMSGIEHQVFELDPFFPSQMQQYIAFWFAQAGSQLTLSDENVNDIISQAEGLPGQAAGPLTQLLLKSASQENSLSSVGGSSDISSGQISAAEPSPERVKQSYQSIHESISRQSLTESTVETIDSGTISDDMLDMVLNGDVDLKDHLDLKDDAVELSSNALLSQAEPASSKDSPAKPKAPQGSKKKRSRRDKNRKKRTAQRANAEPQNTEGSSSARINRSTKTAQKQALSEPNPEARSAIQSDSKTIPTDKTIQKKPPTLYPYLLMFLITCVLGWFLLSLFQGGQVDKAPSTSRMGATDTSFSPTQRAELLNLAADPERKTIN